MLFHVYDDPKPDGYFSHQPDGIYLTLLNADWILYILLPLLAIIIVWVMVVAWRIHEMPAHRADHKKMRQAELVSALTLLGLFMHWVWAIALFLAYVDWEELENGLVRVMRKARYGVGLDDVSVAASAPPAPASQAIPSPAAKTEEGDA